MQTKATILLVHSSESEHHALAQVLQEAGFHVLKAPGGEQALALTDCLPDVILLDSGGSDPELCSRLKTNPVLCDIPIIQIAAKESAPLRNGDQSRADDSISPQAAALELVTKVTAWARARQTEKELRRRNAELERSIQELQSQLNARRGEQRSGEPHEIRPERDFNAAILNTIAALIVVVDRQGVIVRFNHVCEDVTGYSAAEACGRVFWEFVAPEDVAGLRETWGALCAGRFPCQHENSWVAKDGSRRLIDWTNTCVLGSDGSVDYIVATGIDITDRRRAEESVRRSEAELREAQRIGQFGSWFWSVENDKVWWSEETYRISGVDPGQAPPDFFTGHQKLYAPESLERLKSAADLCLRTGTPYEVDLELVRPDGESRWVTARGAAARHENGRVSSLHGTIQDITERKRAEQALKRSESEARARAAEMAAILDAVPAVVFVSDDPQCLRMTSSRAAYELLRVPHGANTSKSAPEGERPTTFRAMRHGKEIPAEELPVQFAARTGQMVRDCELSVVYEDGSARDLLGNAVPLFDEQGKPRGAVAAFIDITERKLAEEALRKSEELLRFHVENTPLAVIEWGADFRLSRWSGEAERIFGWRAEEVLGKRIDELRWVHEDDAAHVAEVSAGLLDGTSPRRVSQNRNYRKDGSVVHCEWYNSSRLDESGRFQSILSLVLDVTESKQAEEALRRSEARYRTLFESMDEGFCVIELIFDEANRPVDYRFIETNPAFSKHLDFKDPVGRTIRELVPDLEAHWFEVFGRVAATGEATRYSIGSQVLKRWYEGYAFRIGEPEQQRVAILFKDITERIRAEAALRESEDRLRSVLENLSEGLMLFDREGNLIYQNPASLRIHGFDLKEDGRIRHENLPVTWDAWDETGRPLTFDEWPVARVFRHERFQDQVLRARRVETGQEFYGSYNGSPLYDSAGNLTAGFITIRDITDQKRTQEALIRNEKLASVGRMAATVAHEINNPLAAVINAIFIARGSLDDPGRAREALNLADEELRRIAHLTRQTLGFYRESSAPAKLLVSEITDSAISLLANKIKAKSAQVATCYSDDLHMVGIAGELRQVCSNLLANSLDAVDTNGTVSLRVSRMRTLSERLEYIRITIADNGPGMPEAVRAHAFEPFFTTKEAVGTGLGLWVSRQIVEKHGGRIRVRSSVRGARRGTTFSVLLPVHLPEAACAGS